MARPKTPLISREVAVQTALEIIDAEGFEGFSLERLARKMGIKAPSLYYHFTNRSDLLTEAARTLLNSVPVEDHPPIDEWQEWFVSLSLRTYRLIMQHPRAAGLLFSYFPSSITMPSHERGAKILADAGVPARARFTVMRGIEKLTFGMAFADADDNVHARDHVPHDLQPGRWPHLIAAVNANRWTSEELFVQTIRTFLAGVTVTLLPPKRRTSKA